MLKQKETLNQSKVFKRYGWFKSLKEVLRDSAVFVTTNMFVSLALILITVIVAFHPQTGAYGASSISYIVVFMFSFLQLSFMIGTILALWSKHHYNDAKITFKQDKNTISVSITYSFIFGIILLLIYFATVQPYNLFANKHTNTQIALESGEQFIWASAAVIVLAPLRAYFSNLIWINNDKRIIFVILLEFALWTTVLVSSFLLAKTSLNYAGYGLGFSLGMILFTLIYAAIHFYQTKWKFKPFIKSLFKFRKDYFLVILKNTWMVFLVQIFTSVVKMFVLVTLFYVINEKVVGSAPLDLQAGRILWYQAMLFVQMFGLGFADFLFYLFQKQKIRNKRYHSRQMFIWVFAIAFAYTMIAAIVFGFSIKPLSTLYALKQNPLLINLEDVPPTHFYVLFKQSLANNPQFVGLIAQKFNQNPQAWISAINSEDEVVWMPLVKSIVDGIWKANHNFATIFNIPNTPNPFTAKFIAINAQAVNNYLTSDKTYIHLTIFSFFYPLGLMLLRYRDLIAQKQQLPFATLILQVLAIAFVVGFGIDYQSTAEFNGLLAWSMPLSITGAFILIIAIIIFLITYSKFITTYEYHDLVKDKERYSLYER